MTTLIVRPTLDRKAYRLRCRFKIEPYPPPFRLDREKVKVAEQFVRDMHKQGWEHVERFGFTMTGPFPMVEPVTIRPRRTPTAREMLPRVARGERFLDDGDTGVSFVSSLGASEYWEYAIAAVFSREQILTERADAHEEELE